MVSRKLHSAALALSLCASYGQSDHFFATVGEGDLFKIHIQSCSTTYVGSTVYQFNDIAMTLSGDLYGIANPGLYRVDTTDATATFIGQPTASGVSLVALNNATLLTEYGQDLYAISTIDATSTYIGNIGYEAQGDLTWYFGSLYIHVLERPAHPYRF